MAAKLNVGVIGLGRIGRVHAANLVGRVPGARLTAGCDADPNAQDRFTAEFAAPVVAQPERLLADATIDAVVIATPTLTHADLITAAARAGKAIFAEKPIALTAAETDAALRAVNAAGVPFQIGFQRRWDAAYLAARRQIEAGAIGEAVLFRASGRDPAPAALAYHDPANSGGIFLDAAIHDFDAARFLMAREVTRVSAHGACLVHRDLARVNDIDTSITVLHFADGALGLTEWNRFAGHSEEISAEVQGSAGALRIGGLLQTPVLTIAGGRASRTLTAGFGQRFAQAFCDELCAFVAAIRAGQRPTPDGEDARRALQIALAARESFTSGASVDLPPLIPLQAPAVGG